LIESAKRKAPSKTTITGNTFEWGGAQLLRRHEKQIKVNSPISFCGNKVEKIRTTKDRKQKETQQAKQLHFLAEQSREPGNRTFGMEFSGRNVLGRTFNDNRTDHHKINPIPDLIGSCGLQGVPLLLLYIHIH